MSLYRKMYSRKKTDLEKFLGKMSAISGAENLYTLPLEAAGKAFFMALVGTNKKKGHNHVG